jgi:hypothetical protein
VKDIVYGGDNGCIVATTGGTARNAVLGIPETAYAYESPAKLLHTWSRCEFFLPMIPTIDSNSFTWKGRIWAGSPDIYASYVICEVLNPLPSWW